MGSTTSIVYTYQHIFTHTHTHTPTHISFFILSRAFSPCTIAFRPSMNTHPHTHTHTHTQTPSTRHIVWPIGALILFLHLVCLCHEGLQPLTVGYTCRLIEWPFFLCFLSFFLSFLPS